MSDWQDGLVQWERGGYLCISVAFTWRLKDARAIALQEGHGPHLMIGGPAVALMPEIVDKWRHMGIPFETPPLQRHNPNASRSTIGCDRGCPFCGVGQIEGAFRELNAWEPAPIMCDSNFLQCSDVHFNAAIHRLKQLESVDFNQGLDARHLTRERIRRLVELPLAKVRLAWDMPQDEGPVMAAIERLHDAGIGLQRIDCYVLINWQETIDEATYRLETLRERGVRAFAMRYQPLDALERNEYLAPQWNEWLLTAFTRYWNRQVYFGGMTFAEYCDWRGTHEQTMPHSGQQKLALDSGGENG